MNGNGAELRTSATGGTVAINSVWNLLGQVVPMVPAVLCIPALVRGLGVERFGILTLIWVVIGYFGLFDLGLGRSLTKLVAEKTDQNDDEETSRLVWTALFLLLLLSLVGALLVASFSAWFAGKVLAISRPLQGETVMSLRLLALGIPAVFLSGGLKGVLEARGRFGLTNAVRIPTGVFSFVGPLIALQFSNSLATLTAILVAGRVVTCVSLFALCLIVAPSLRRVSVLDLSLARPLIRLGGWMTVSNLVGPFMVYLDRFMIGVIAPMAIVAYYTTPFEAVSRLLMIPGSLAAVLFPLFSRGYAYDRQGTSRLFSKGIKYLFFCLFPPVLLVVTFAREGLALWLGNVFAQNSTGVLQCLGIGMFFNSLAQVAYALVQGGGRPDLTAKLHLIELPLYLVALRLLIGAYGVFGAAVAWLVRALIDGIVLFGLAGRMLPLGKRVLRQLVCASTAAGAALTGATLLPTAAARLAFIVAVCCIFGIATWLVVLTPGERDLLRRPVAAATRWLTR